MSAVLLNLLIAPESPVESTTGTAGTIHFWDAPSTAPLDTSRIIAKYDPKQWQGLSESMMSKAKEAALDLQGAHPSKVRFGRSGSRPPAIVLMSPAQVRRNDKDDESEEPQLFWAYRPGIPTTDYWRSYTSAFSGAAVSTGAIQRLSWKRSKAIGGSSYAISCFTIEQVRVPVGACHWIHPQ